MVESRKESPNDDINDSNDIDSSYTRSRGKARDREIAAVAARAMVA